MLGRESLTPPALRCAPLIGARLCRSDYRTLLYGHRLFFNFFHFFIFSRAIFFRGRLGARFLLFGLGRWGRGFVSEICEMSDFHFFMLSACYSCRRKYFFRFQDSQAYMFVSPSLAFLSQLYLRFLQPNLLTTFLEKPTFSTELYP